MEQGRRIIFPVHGDRRTHDDDDGAACGPRGQLLTRDVIAGAANRLSASSSMDAERTGTRRLAGGRLGTGSGGPAISDGWRATGDDRGGPAQREASATGEVRWRRLARRAACDARPRRRGRAGSGCASERAGDERSNEALQMQRYQVLSGAGALRSPGEVRDGPFGLRRPSVQSNSSRARRRS